MEYSQKSYDKLWKSVIKPQIAAFEAYVLANNLQFGIAYNDNATKEKIWQEYEKFRDSCKDRYMKKSDKEHVIDRHKVCACMIYAIIKVSPFQKIGEAFNEDDYFDTPNEQLAITVGLSLLRSYIVNAKNDFEGNKKSAEEIKNDKRIFENGFIFPENSDINHGEYRNNFAIELYYTKKEGNYNILLLSNALYLLELYNRKMWELHEKNKGKK